MGAKLRRTALYQEHVEAGANIVDFHGVELPIWYSSISDEHLATRNSAGLFDVSHMGFFRFSGAGLLDWLESISTQKISAINPGRCAYTHFLDANGHIIDDMIFAVTNAEEIAATDCTKWKGCEGEVVLGVPNASMIGTMRKHFEESMPDDGTICFEDLSAETSILALQGPNSPQILGEVLGHDNVVSRFKGQAICVNEFGISGWIQGTGYTGERGFEIFIDNHDAPILWRALLASDPSHGLVPVGLGARDTLRLEKGYLLSGQDFLWPPLGDAGEGLPAGFLARNSWETNVPFGLDLEHQFTGRDAVTKSAQSNGQKWWGLKYLGKGPLPRNGKAVARFSEGVGVDDAEIIGYITSGGPSPSLDRVGIGMAYLKGVKEGDHVLVIASARKLVEAEIIRPPFI
ncbi:MAG: glycine cleavage T C-terminal barrel domain-containing protein [Candidatus Poseidoniaceae archaeon]|jgi:aminomethyltransferase|nr:glycine cleavage T C-terminal barrel domain-containing protein [Candidatus Poseidoniaceae archaeon]